MCGGAVYPLPTRNEESTAGNEVTADPPSMRRIRQISRPWAELAAATVSEGGNVAFAVASMHAGHWGKGRYVYRIRRCRRAPRPLRGAVALRDTKGHRLWKLRTVYSMRGPRPELRGRGDACRDDEVGTQRRFGEGEHETGNDGFHVRLHDIFRCPAQVKRMTMRRRVHTTARRPISVR